MKPYGIIYKITNRINGKSYIGLTTVSLQRRWGQHIYSSKTKNYPLYYSIRKYGIEKFSIEVLCICYSKEELDNEENEYIKKYNSKNRDFGYNLRDGGNGGNLSEETKKKISLSKIGISRSEETKEKLSKANLGKTVSEDIKDKIGNAFRGDKNPNAILNKKEVDEIRYLYSLGNITQKCLAEKYNVKECTVFKIINYLSWNDERVIKEPTSIKSKFCRKLDWYKIIEICTNKDNLTNQQLADKYGVHKNLICKIMNGKKWDLDKSPKEIKDIIPKDFKINKINKIVYK